MKARIEFSLANWKTEVLVECESKFKGGLYAFSWPKNPRLFLADLHKELRAYFPEERGFCSWEKKLLHGFFEETRLNFPKTLRFGSLKEIRVVLLGFEE